MNTRSVVVWAGWLLALWVPTRARAEGAPPAAAEYELSNGLRVVLAPDPQVTGVTVAMSYAVGQAHDPRDYRGMAHLVEHLTFRGSRHLRAYQGDEILSRVGASSNAYTSLQRTVYLTNLPSSGLETVLWLEGERMAFTLDGIDAATLDLEKKVVRRELAERGGTRDRMRWNLAAAALYAPGHPFSPPEHEAADVAAIDLRSVQWFFQSSYRPDNATLAVSGKFNLDEAKGWVAKYFSSIENPPLPKLVVDAPAPKLCKGQLLSIGYPFLLAQDLEVFWVLPEVSSALDRVSVDAVRLLFETRLRAQLVRQFSWVSAVQVGLERLDSHDLLTVSAEVQGEDRWTEIEQTIEKEARRIALEPIGEAELRTLRQRLLRRSFNHRESGERAIEGMLDGEDLDARRAALLRLDALKIRATAQPLTGASLRVRGETSTLATKGTAIVLDEEKSCR